MISKRLRRTLLRLEFLSSCMLHYNNGLVYPRDLATNKGRDEYMRISEGIRDALMLSRLGLAKLVFSPNYGLRVRPTPAGRKYLRQQWSHRNS